MCTAVSFTTKDHYFGRNLDYDFSYREAVVITPRNYVFSFRNGMMNKYVSGVDEDNEQRNYEKNVDAQSGYAMIGMAYVVNNYPLYYDAVNEVGLGMAGLLFAGNAVYCPVGNDGVPAYSSRKRADCAACRQSDEGGKLYIASYEFIPWILRNCSNVEDAVKKLEKVCITDQAFSKELPPSPLHWMLADKMRTIVVESVEEGLKVYENPIHVLTNNPTFDYHLMNLNHFIGLSAYEPDSTFCDRVSLTAYSRGMGAIGLPGDLSSESRFVRAAFTRMNSVCKESETESVSQFFHILGSVEQVRGCVRLSKEDEKNNDNRKMEAEGNGETGKETKYEITIYSACCNTDKGIYYYKTYDNHQIESVDMHKENLEGCELVSYSLNIGNRRME